MVNRKQLQIDWEDNQPKYLILEKDERHVRLSCFGAGPTTTFRRFERLCCLDDAKIPVLEKQKTYRRYEQDQYGRVNAIDCTESEYQDFEYKQWVKGVRESQGWLPILSADSPTMGFKFNTIGR